MKHFGSVFSHGLGPRLTPIALAVSSLVAGSLATATAGTIVWISQVESDAGKEFLTLLQSKGHAVTERIVTSASLTQAEIDEMNAASVVIFGRKAASTNYNTPDWDDITAPMIVFTPYMTRSSIWGWFNGTGLVDQTPDQMVVNEPAHDLFKGITLTDGMTEAWHLAIDRGTSFSTDVVENGGTLLASTPSGAVAAAQWPDETVASGPRMLLCMGSRETADIATAGKYAITPLGEQILLNAVAIYAPLNPADSDGDGVPNALDAFPNNPNESEDTDSDGTGNNADTDDDNDGVLDAADAFPKNSGETKDLDADGLGDNADTDDDNDWVPDTEDKFSLNAAEWDDDDSDGLGNNADPDDDGNGIPDPRVSNVVWVSQEESEIGREFLDLLTAEGHTVTRFVGNSQTLADTPALVARVMNTASVVIFSRQISSDQYNTAVWDQIKAPMLVMTPYILRASRWAWFATEALTAGTPASMLVSVPAHPLLAGIPVDGGATGPWYVEVDRGTSFMADLAVGAGTAIATAEDGSLAAAQWPAGTVAAGPRMFLAMGAWEPDGAGAAAAGSYNLTEVGARVLLNAVSIYSAPVTTNRFQVSAASFDTAARKFSLTWPSQSGQTFHVERSSDLATWETIMAGIAAAAGNTTSFTDQNLPASATAFAYRVVREN